MSDYPKRVIYPLIGSHCSRQCVKFTYIRKSWFILVIFTNNYDLFRSDADSTISQKIVPCRIRLDSVEDEDCEEDIESPEEPEVDTVNSQSVLNPQPLTSILNSLIHHEETLVTKADVHHTISSRNLLTLRYKKLHIYRTES